MTEIAAVFNGLPAELVELVIEYACCDKFVLVSESPVYELRYVEHPPEIADAMGGFNRINLLGLPQDGWYYIQWIDMGEELPYWTHAPMVD